MSTVCRMYLEYQKQRVALLLSSLLLSSCYSAAKITISVPLLELLFGSDLFFFSRRGAHKIGRAHV